MNTIKLQNISYPFSKREKDALELLCNCYLRYNPKIASFLYMVMGKDPKDTNYKLDFSNLDFKWFYDNDPDVLGAWCMTKPNTVYIRSTAPSCTDNWKNKSDYILGKKVGYYLAISSMLTNFGTIMHEFYHMFQFKTNPAAYIAMRFVTLFTRIPYYIITDENKLQAYNKLVEWDLEGQAMKYGDQAEGIEYFCRTLDMVFSSLRRNANKTYTYYLDTLVKDKSIPKEFITYGNELLALLLKEG